jgi:putative SOS response-associated peptidase YedK
MCGRYAYFLPPEAMLALFQVMNDIMYGPRFNVTPTQPIIGISEQQGVRKAQYFRWGLMPGWVKDPREFPLLINARAETMAEKPAFRDAVRHMRCVIPANGYYEWMKAPGGKRLPYYITLADGEPMAFAGLYSIWSGPDGEEVDTAAIVTVEPNLEISSIYDRMPAILRGKAAIDGWLNTREVDVKQALELATTLPEGSLKYHPVGRAIGRADSEGPELIKEIDPATEPVEEPKKKKKTASGQLDLF